MHLAIQEAHRATFRGKHNSIKSLVLAFLSLVEDCGISRYFSVAELVRLLDLSASYTTNNRFKLWHKWRYLGRRPLVINDRMVWGYKLAGRGRHFILMRMPDDVYADCVLRLKELGLMANKNNGEAKTE